MASVEAEAEVEARGAMRDLTTTRDTTKTGTNHSILLVLAMVEAKGIVLLKDTIMRTADNVISIDNLKIMRIEISVIDLQTSAVVHGQSLQIVGIVIDHLIIIQPNKKMI